jgi:uncharacterized protein
MRHLNRSIAALAGLVFALLFTCSPARADVRDAAGFFSTDAVAKANELIGQVRQKHGKDVIVETVSSLPDAPADAAAREKYFQDETSRRGKAAGIKGLYILISRNPSSLYAGVDPDTQAKLFTLEDRGRLKELLIQRFKAKDFDGGLLSGMRMVDETMAAHASGRSTAAPAGAAPPRSSGSGAGSSGSTGSGTSKAPAPVAKPRTMGLMGWVCLGAGVLIVLAIVRGFMRRRQMPPGGYGMQQPGYGQPGYGQPGYPPQQQGGGFGRGILGGLLGGVAGGYLYDQMRGQGNEAQAAPPPPADPSSSSLGAPDSTSGFGDFGDSGGGGGDFGGGGGDFGGGDSGGGGGDF